MKYFLVLILSLSFCLLAQNEFHYRDPLPYARSEEIDEVLTNLIKSRKSSILLTGKIGTDFYPILNEIKAGFSFYYKERNLPAPIVNQFEAYQLSSILRSIDNAYKVKQPILVVVNNAQSLTKLQLAFEQLMPLMDKEFGYDSHQSPVKFLFTTNAANARFLTSNDNFSRLLTKIHLHELTKEESITAIKNNQVLKWRKLHKQFQGISEKALEYAAHFYHLEQSGVSRKAAMSELIEGAIVFEAKKSKNKFNITENEIRNYIQVKSKLELMPGAKNFESEFEKKWAEFGQSYGGDEGLKYQYKKVLYQFFAQQNKRKMTSLVLHGAPGSGKTYLGEVTANTFFKGSILKISGAELKNSSDLSKLIGSPPGYVGSDQMLGILTKFLSAHPTGGVIVIEEADYMHQDIVKFLTNMKSDMKFTDGLGRQWDCSAFMLMQNTNIGQDSIIPVDSQNAMTWDQYEMRISQMTETIQVDGKSLNIVKSSVLSQMQEEYIEQIVMGSNPNTDTSQVAQEANKQKRRDTHLFVQSPSQENLLEVANINFKKIAKRLLIEKNISLKISKRSLRKIIDVQRYEFFKGYSYVAEQLEKNLLNHLPSLPLRKGDSLDIKVVDNSIQFVRNTALIDKEVDLVVSSKSSDNPWRASTKIRDNINNLAKNMSKYLKGSQSEIDATKAVLKKSLVDYNSRKVFTLLGTTGNGKTQYAKALSIALHGDKNALFRVTGLNTPGDLNSYLRPSAGYIGSNKETEFEKWFKSRQKAGGGVILFDELLSFAGLSSNQLGEKVAVLNELYDLLDEGKLKIAGKVYDARSFVIVLTGNSLQERFMAIPPGLDGERQAAKIAKEITQSEIVDYFSKLGIDAPKVARMGHVFVKGQLPQKIAKQIVTMQTNSELNDLIKTSGYNVELVVDPQLLKILSEKLPTSSLGFRNVEKGVEKALVNPLTGILADIPNISKVEVSIKGKEILWKVNEESVYYVSEKIEGYDANESSWKMESQITGDFKNRTPDINSIVPKLKKNEALNVEVVSIHEVEGHWMVDYMLSGKNNADFISMIPDSGYLGYVRPRETNHIMNLSELFKEMIVLEAGHRSVIYRGIHAPGAGTSGKRVDGKSYNDDLFKVNRTIETIINNKIFPEYSELQTKELNDFFRLTIQEVVKEMADYLIHKGNELEISAPLMKKLKEDTYLTGEFIDEYIQKSHQSFGLDHFEEMKSALNHAYDKIISKQSLTSKIKNYFSQTQKKKLLNEIKSKLTQDVNSAQNFCNKLYN